MGAILLSHSCTEARIRINPLSALVTRMLADFLVLLFHDISRDFPRTHEPPPAQEGAAGLSHAWGVF